MKIYKYFSPSENTEKVFNDEALYFSTPQEFNDPFECLIHKDIVEDLSKKIERPIPKDINSKRIFHSENLKEAVKNDSKFLEKKFPFLENNLTNTEKIQILTEYLSIYYPENYYIDNILNVMFEKTGVISFTYNKNSILMWSHYAKNHTGICLEFELEVLNKTLGKCYEMNYVNDIPEDYKDLRAGDYILTKQKSWEYEEEVRFYEIVYPWETVLQGNGQKKYIKEALTGIIFGCRVNPNDYKKYLSLAQGVNLSCKIYRAQKVYGKYELEIKEFKIENPI